MFSSLVPILLLAYAALYAIAAPLPTANLYTADTPIRNPKNLVELDVRDAIAAASELPAATVELGPSKKSKRDVNDERFTVVAGSTSMAGKMRRSRDGPLMEGGTSTLSVGEGQGFFWSCEGRTC